MANNLRLFNTNSEYQSADLILPSVSYVIETDKVIYDYTPPTPPVFQGKWKATYWDGRIISAECDSTSAITNGEVGNYGEFSLEIGDCVTSIDNYAFSNYHLTSIDIPSGVTSIGNSAFGECTSLTSIDIPSGVTAIGDRAFNGCRNLAGITVNATTPPLLFPLFVSRPFDITNDCPIYVPSQSVNEYKSAISWSYYASRIYPIP